jgi:hypothetical protein
MYACVREAGRGFLEGGVQVRGSATHFTRPTPPPSHSQMQSSHLPSPRNDHDSLPHSGIVQGR